MPSARDKEDDSLRVCNKCLSKYVLDLRTQETDPGQETQKSRRIGDSELAHEPLLLRPVFALVLNQIQQIMLNSEQ
jgi:hypothetical protein